MVVVAVDCSVVVGHGEEEEVRPSVVVVPVVVGPGVVVDPAMDVDLVVVVHSGYVVVSLVVVGHGVVVGPAVVVCHVVVVGPFVVSVEFADENVIAMNSKPPDSSVTLHFMFTALKHR